MTLKFTPPKQVARYALFIDKENGKGSFKIYNELGHLKNAFHARAGQHRAAKILEMVDGEWYVLHDIPKGTEYKNLPWVKAVKRGRYWNAQIAYPEAVPMTRDEYADWRIKVEHERLQGIDYEIASP